MFFHQTFAQKCNQRKINVTSMVSHKNELNSKLCILLTMLTLIACDNQPSKSKIDNPLAKQVEALDKAKDVEKQLLEAQKRTQEALKKATE